MHIYQWLGIAEKLHLLQFGIELTQKSEKDIWLLWRPNWNPKWSLQIEIKANTWQEGSQERNINISCEFKRRKKGFATEAKKYHCESLTEHESAAHSYYF